MKLNIKHILLILLSLLLVTVFVLVLMVYGRVSGFIQMLLGRGNAPSTSPETTGTTPTSSISTSSTTLTQPGHTHDFKKEKTVKPTCTDIGYTVYACACGEKVLDNKPANGHSWGEEVTVPVSCDADGYTEKVCTVCGHAERSNIQPGSHDFEPWGKPDPINAGHNQEQRLCKTCGAVEIRAAGNSNAYILRRYPSTRENGYLTYKIVVAIPAQKPAPTYQIYVGLDESTVYYTYANKGLTLYYSFNNAMHTYLAPATGNHSVTLYADGNVVLGQPAES